MRVAKSLRPPEIQAEPQRQSPSTHIHETHEHLGSHLANLVAHPAGDQRRLRIVDDDARVAVEPTVTLVYLCLDGSPPQWRYEVHQLCTVLVEHLALPGDQPCDLGQHPTGSA